ncbi:MAG TPA: AIR synthase-related protein, partial [Bauldia sp.]|nr:AIR synthase-related protein [Bauldia sp.]
VKSLLAALMEPGRIKALAHITGGGFVDNIPRVIPPQLAARIDLSTIDVPPVFRWLAEAGPIAESEMLRTFNCGVGMVAVVAPDMVEAVVETLVTEGETVFRLGRVEPRQDAPIVFDGTLDLKMS